MKVGMTEQEWLEGDALWRMLHHALYERAFSARKQILFCVSVCRLRGSVLPSDYAPILDDLEVLADGPDMPELEACELFSAWLNRREVEPGDFPLRDPLRDLQRRASEVVSRRFATILSPGEPVPWDGDPRFEVDDAVMFATMAHPFACCYGDGEGDIQRSRPEADSLRELLGNPFRRFPRDSAWQSSTIQGFARTIYEDRSFDALPILGDALEDVGADAAILDHLRSAGSHVRGCWALDLILGKS